MANYNELKTRARVIQNETEDGQNTADRVGSLFYDIIAALADVDGGGGSSSTVPNITAAATVNNSTGTPYVDVVKDGTDEAPRFTFNFSNLKGATGPAGATGATGPRGPQGVKGDPGEGIDAETIQHIKDLEKDLEDLMDGLDTEMEEKAKDLFKDAEFLEELFPDGGGGYSNFGQALNDYTDKYLQIIGMWEEDPTTHQKVYKWSKIQQEYNQIQSRVATLETVAGFPDSYEALVADLIQGIKDDEAFAELMTGYATVQDVNNVKTVVEWLYSGLRNSTTPDRTISEIVSAGKNALGGAIADMRTYVEKLKSGEYVAKASLTAALTDDNNKVLTDAGVLFEATLDQSLSTFFAKNSGNTASISALANKLGSVIEISADNIILDGTTWADIINFDTLLSEAGNDTVSITSSTIDVYSQGYKGSDYTSIEPHTITLYQQTSGNLSEATLWAHGFSWQGLEYDKATGLHFGSTISSEYAATIWVNGTTCEFESAQSLSITADGTLYLTGSDINLGTLGGDKATTTLALKANEITASSPITTSSDERLKTIVSVLEPDIEAIAQVRIVDFYYNSDSKQTHQVGSIAQDWQEVFPLAIKTDKEGYLGLNYSTVALASAVTAAREIIALKVKVAELESKLAN